MSNPVELYEYKQGIFNIKMIDRKNKNQLTIDIINGLLECFHYIDQNHHAKVILLEGDDDIFLTDALDDRVEECKKEIITALLKSSLPIISVIKGESRGLGYLVGLLGDIIILSQNSKYNHRYIIDTKDEVNFQTIFNQNFGNHFLKLEKEYWGQELQALNTGINILPKDKIDEYKIDLAKQMAQGTIETIKELKKHYNNLLQEELHHDQDPIDLSLLSWSQFAEKNVPENSSQLLSHQEIQFSPLAINSKVMDVKVSQSGIVLVTMNDQESKNTFSDQFMNGIVEVFKYIEKNDDYKVVILTGYDSYFSCGGTKQGLDDILSGKNKFTDSMIYSLPLEEKIPVIAAMQGHGIGGGFSIGLFCDEIILSEESVYTANFMKFGFTPGTGSTLIFPERLGYSLGKEILFSTKQYQGLDLKKYGLRCAILKREAVLSYAMELAHQLTFFSRQELIDRKDTINKRLRSKIKEVYQKELSMHERTFVGNREAQQRIEQYFNETLSFQQKDKTLLKPEGQHLIKKEDTEADSEHLQSIRKKLTLILSKELFLDEKKIEGDRPFLDMGMDSIISVTFIKKINHAYTLDIPATKIYSHPCINRLSGYILEQAQKKGFFSQDEEFSLPMTQSENQISQTGIDSEHLQSIRKKLTLILSKELFLDEKKIEGDRPFLDMGMDSIISVTFIKKINHVYTLDIPATKIYSHPCINRLSEYILEQAQKKGFFSLTIDPQIDLKKGEEREFNQKRLRKIRGSQRFANRQEHTAEPQSQIIAHPHPGDSYGLKLSRPQDYTALHLYHWLALPPNANELTIEVKASAINFPDTMCVNGLYPTMPDYPFVPGFEVCGIVTRLGSSDCEFKIGDEVIAITGPKMGGHASHVTVPLENVVCKPPNISFEEGCSLPLVFETVDYAFELGKLKPHEKVLIQTATGGCGLMALQLAHLKNCICYGTSSKKHKQDILRQLGLSYVTNYQHQFDREILEKTDQQGIDVVLNMLSGDGIQKGLHCLASSGRYLELAVHALKTSHKLDLSNLIDNQAFLSIDLRRLAANSSHSSKERLNKMVAMIGKEEIVPIVSRIYPVHKIGEALQYVAQGQHIGKVVISHTRQKVEDCQEKCISRLLEQKQRAIKKTHQKVIFSQQSKSYEKDNAIAIIGMSGQFPMADDLQTYWNNIKEGKNCIREIPEERWDIKRYFDEDKSQKGKTYNKYQGVVASLAEFDPLFFNISPKEASLMDPQQRIYLQTAWKCIEDAGYNPYALSGSRCGVYVGCGVADYGQMSDTGELNAKGLMGSSASILSSRISYFLNLQGPCLAIDTACSSSLVAIAQACNSIVLNRCDMALAGGVSALCSPAMHIMMSSAGMLSEDGRCFTFDNRANGFVPGEGAGVILLKHLADAKRDRDHIYGIIKGWAVNQDGKTNGMTAPNGDAQTRLETEVYEKFNINPESITLIEAHGTGTKLGDPIEVEALVNTFQQFTQKENYCALGSVKSNIGHLLPASGVAGLIKVLLALKNKQIPATINYQTLNEHIHIKNSPFYINTQLKDWQVDQGMKRCAAVSSFGFSGTNAHIVIEEHIQVDDEQQKSLSINSQKPVLIILSAKSKKQLSEQVVRLLHHLNKHYDADQSLINLAYTLQIGRQAMEERAGFLVNSIAELKIKLKEYEQGKEDCGRLYTGSTVENKHALVLFNDDSDLEETIKAWIEKKKYKKLLELWVKGLDINWQLLYQQEKPGRMSLPTYPFTREKYWIAQEEEKMPNTVKSGLNYIHPLLHENTSHLQEQKYTSFFTGNEFFLQDYVIDGHKVFPGEALIEMARVALEKTTHVNHKTVILENVVYTGCLFENFPENEINIAILPEKNSKLLYEIYTVNQADRSDEIIYCQGETCLEQVSQISGSINIEKIKTNCQESFFNQEQCYQLLESQGFHFGPGFQTISHLYLGKDQALAKLKLPEKLKDSQQNYYLHPAIMSGALQAVRGLIFAGHTQTHQDSQLSFKAGKVEMIDHTEQEMWVVIKSIDQNQSTAFNIHLCDKEGRLKLKIHNLQIGLAREPEQNTFYPETSLDTVFKEIKLFDLPNQTFFDHLPDSQLQYEKEQKSSQIKIALHQKQAAVDHSTVSKKPKTILKKSGG